jgi:hypothetical protein
MPPTNLQPRDQADSTVEASTCNSLFQNSYSKNSKIVCSNLFCILLALFTDGKILTVNRWEGSQTSREVKSAYCADGEIGPAEVTDVGLRQRYHVLNKLLSLNIEILE